MRHLSASIRPGNTICDITGLYIPADGSVRQNTIERNPGQQSFRLYDQSAAQAGVRYSLKNPEAYIQSNICGFLNLLEGCRNHNCPRLIYASSSSVYGNSQNVPFNEAEQVDHPVSIYAATKKSNELMAYTYSHLYKIHTIGLRFFTVYGPYGRPDMAPILFAGSIAADRPIRIFNNGKLARDFTYIDDIIEGIVKITEHPEQASEDTAGIPAVIYNIGHGSSMQLMDFIHILERNLGKEAQKEYVGMQPAMSTKPGPIPVNWNVIFIINRRLPSKKALPGLHNGIKNIIKIYNSVLKQGVHRTEFKRKLNSGIIV